MDVSEIRSLFPGLRDTIYLNTATIGSRRLVSGIFYRETSGW